MRHERHYTLDEARAALPALRDLIARLRAARRGLVDEGARLALSGAAPANGGGMPGRQVGQAFVELQRAVVELEGMGVVLRDLDRGLVDFPSLREGREVYLCWEEPEPEIEHWHDLDSGYGERRTL